jgi:hypothetical protein
LKQKLQKPNSIQSLDAALDVVTSPLNSSWVALCFEMIFPGFTVFEPED